MKRYLPGLLAAYALSLTLFTAWLGCRLYVYRRVLKVYNGPAYDFTQALANFNSPLHLNAPLDGPAILFASLEPVNLAAASFVIFFSFVAFALKRRTKTKTNHPPED